MDDTRSRVRERIDALVRSLRSTVGDRRAEGWGDKSDARPSPNVATDGGTAADTGDAGSGPASPGDAGTDGTLDRAAELLAHPELLDAIPEPTFALAADHEVVAWNRALGEFTGTPPEEAIGTKQASDQIQDALTALDDIAGAVDETAVGIEEVADANDDQARTIEEITGTVTTVQEHAAAVEGTVERVSTAAEDQEEIARVLSDRVGELTGHDD